MYKKFHASQKLLRIFQVPVSRGIRDVDLARVPNLVGTRLLLVRYRVQLRGSTNVVITGGDSRRPRWMAAGLSHQRNIIGVIRDQALRVQIAPHPAL